MKRSRIAGIAGCLICTGTLSYGLGDGVFDDVIATNTVHAGVSLGVGMSTNSSPSEAIEVQDGKILINNAVGASGLWLKDSTDGDQFRIDFSRNLNRLEITAATGVNWPESTLFLDKSGYFGVGGINSGSRMYVRQDNGDTYGVAITSDTAEDANLGFMHGGDIGALLQLEAHDDDQLALQVADTLGGTLATAAEFFPDGDILIGGGFTNAVVFEVEGNVVAEDPVADTHVVTKGWLSSTNAAPAILLAPQGDISMGSYTNGPVAGQ